jgi:hypothetical protein
MTCDEFNEKYKDYLEKGFYGLEFDRPLITEYLDMEFQKFIKRPDFKYAQIKFKFGDARFYAEGISADEADRVEYQINILHKIRV